MDHQMLRSADAPAWEGLRLSIRSRYAAACCHLLDHGTIQRADVMRIGEVSRPQASLDLRGIQERCPGLMVYDKTARCYKLASAEAA